MDIDRFVSLMQEAFAGDPAAAELPRDRRFSPIMRHIHGFSSENILTTLNLAVRCLEPEEVYFEVGSLNGLTLYGAGFENDRLLIAVDNFCMSYEGVPTPAAGERDLYRNLREHMADLNMRFFEKDCWEFMANDLLGVLGPGKVGVYFYDGAHDYESQYRALEMMEQLGALSDEALILVDDANDADVRRANEERWQGNRHYSLLFDLPSPANGTRRGWWNGLQILRRRAPTLAAR